MGEVKEMNGNSFKSNE